MGRSDSLSERSHYFHYVCNTFVTALLILYNLRRYMNIEWVCSETLARAYSIKNIIENNICPWYLKEYYQGIMFFKMEFI